MQGTQKTVDIDSKQDCTQHTTLTDTITKRELSRVCTIPTNTQTICKYNRNLAIGIGIPLFSNFLNKTYSDQQYQVVVVTGTVYLHVHYATLMSSRF